MKTKVARKAVRHAKQFRKVARGKKHARPAAGPNKGAVQNVAAKPEMIAATFEAPIEFVEVDLQPEIDMIEVFEVLVPGAEDEG
jgi:hypothetical protein